MKTIMLNIDFSLGIEFDSKKIRLIVFEKGEELVCHKTTANELQNFLVDDDNSLFRGRLQLIKKQDIINVEFKKEVVGDLEIDIFKSFLRNNNL